MGEKNPNGEKVWNGGHLANLGFDRSHMYVKLT